MNDENSSEVDPIIEEIEFELRKIKVAENRIGSLQGAEAGHHVRRLQRMEQQPQRSMIADV
jgi:hypothetical protein